MYKSVSELIENYEQHTSNDRNLCKQGYIDEKTYREHCDLYYSEFCKELEKLEQQSIIKQLLSHIVSLSDKTNWNEESSLLIFNRNEMAGEFIRKSCLSDVPFIKEWALYYRDNWLEELERNN